MKLALALVAIGIGAATAQEEAEAVAISEPVGGVQPTITDGDCLIDVRLQDEGEDLAGKGVPIDWHADGNIIVKLAGDACSVGVSPTWTISGWDYTFVQLAPNAVFNPPDVADNERQLVKIMRGSLINANLNGIFDGEKWETYVVTPPNRAISMFIDNSVDDITAGAEGAVIAYIKVPETVLNTPMTDMASSPATDIAGPFSENLKWNQFGSLPIPATWGFEGVEFWNLAGILLQENDASRLAYLQFWTFREDGHADGYHDHSNMSAEYDDFGEIHMAMYAANGVSGMQTTLPDTVNQNYEPNPVDTSATEENPNPKAWDQNDQTEVQIAIPMPPGFAHGPLWSVIPETGEPTKTCRGGISYPFHRWLIDSNGPANSPLRYSMWVAFEHLPADVTVPLKMITEWPNAYLQSNMPGCDDEPATAENGEDSAVTTVNGAPTAENGGETTTADVDCASVCGTSSASFVSASMTALFSFLAVAANRFIA